MEPIHSKKTCADCNLSKTFEPVVYCCHKKARYVVGGELFPLPTGIVRKQEGLCGPTAKWFTPIPKLDPPPSKGARDERHVTRTPWHTNPKARTRTDGGPPFKP